MYHNKELSFWWIFSYLVLLIAELKNERSLTIFYRWQIITYIHANILQKSDKISFSCQGRLNHYKSLNLLCIYSIWLFTAFAQINTSNSQQIICVDTLLGNGISPSILDKKNKMNLSISKQVYGNLYWVFLSHWHNLFNNLQYSHFFIAQYNTETIKFT